MDNLSDIPDPDELNDDQYPGLYTFSPACTSTWTRTTVSRWSSYAVRRAT